MVWPSMHFVKPSPLCCIRVVAVILWLGAFGCKGHSQSKRETLLPNQMLHPISEQLVTKGTTARPVPLLHSSGRGLLLAPIARSTPVVLFFKQV